MSKRGNVRCFMPHAPSWRASGNAMRWDIPDAEPGGMLAVESAARAARARAGPSQLVMPLFSNAGFMPYLRNLLCSLQRLDVDNWFVIALDNETCPLLGATEGHCVQPYRDGGGGGSGAGSNGGGGRSGVGRTVQSYGSFGFYWIAMQRPLWLYWLLGRGHSVINCDLDIVWLRDPRPHLSQPGHASADMLFQPDTGHGVNGGFYVARPTPRVLTLFEAWLADLALKATARKGFEEQAESAIPLTLTLTPTLILTLTLTRSSTRSIARCASTAHGCDWSRARSTSGAFQTASFGGSGPVGAKRTCSSSIATGSRATRRAVCAATTFGFWTSTTSAASQASTRSRPAAIDGVCPSSTVPPVCHARSCTTAPSCAVGIHGRANSPTAPPSRPQAHRPASIFKMQRICFTSMVYLF